MSHSEGKLIIIENSICGHCDLDHPVIDLMLETQEDNGDSLTELVCEISLSDKDIADRLAACWNACEGIKAEELPSVIRQGLASQSILEQTKGMVKAVDDLLQEERRNVSALASQLDHELEVKEELLEACKEFVRKVECGEARSVRSYKQMKQAIKRAEKGESTMARYDRHGHKMMFTEGEFRDMGLGAEASLEETLDCFDEEGGVGSREDLLNWYRDLRESK